MSTTFLCFNLMGKHAFKFECPFYSHLISCCLFSFLLTKLQGSLESLFLLWLPALLSFQKRNDLFPLLSFHNPLSFVMLLLKFFSLSLSLYIYIYIDRYRYRYRYIYTHRYIYIYIYLYTHTHIYIKFQSVFLSFFNCLGSGLTSPEKQRTLLSSWRWRTCLALNKGSVVLFVGCLGIYRLCVCVPMHTHTHMHALVVSHSLWPRGLQPASLLCPWIF